MKCFNCEEEARGVCQFCGLAICAIHRQTKTFITGYGKKTRSAIFDSGSKTGIHVSNASWCGQCDVHYQESF